MTEEFERLTRRASLYVCRRRRLKEGSLRLFGDFDPEKGFGKILTVLSERKYATEEELGNDENILGLLIEAKLIRKTKRGYSLSDLGLRYVKSI